MKKRAVCLGLLAASTAAAFVLAAPLVLAAPASPASPGAPGSSGAAAERVDHPATQLASKLSPLNPPASEMPPPFSAIGAGAADGGVAGDGGAPGERDPNAEAVDHDQVLFEIAKDRARAPSAANQPPAQWRLDDVKTRVAEAEELLYSGKVNEAIVRLSAMIEHPRFEAFAEDDAGRAAVYLLGDAYATAGIYEAARTNLRRVLTTRGAWNNRGTYARRAVRRLVEMAIEGQLFAKVSDDLRAVPAQAPEETRGEIAYLTGRAREAAGDPEGAFAAYGQVTQRSRFWAQATYLQGLIAVEKGRYKEGENLFCKVADPMRQSHTTRVFADEHYFAVRDLARLALGRVAHEQFRFDDSRYYYYLVPRDSDRLAEALYEAATGRYEKKDYQGARELLDELRALRVHHAYEDEAWILDAYVDLAQCKFPEADQKLITFIRRYEPVRDTARRTMTDERAMQSIVTAARSGTDAGPAATIAALLRINPTYGMLTRKRAVLDRETRGLTASAPLQSRIDTVRREIAQAETELAKDALGRLDRRLSRLLRRARLARIESVLGRKRALEVEIEAIQSGILPRGALDSLDAARYLQDNEEYWPFEGDDWPDEFVGGEGPR
ncbi:hypothetical protein [Pendulispora albinea]|uniref:Tetratricopeptide repeat protein n=1 Tax=Pendulispora albinea TaxID=2741071 RepID=A0ABZ2M2D0_9BACT